MIHLRRSAWPAPAGALVLAAIVALPTWAAAQRPADQPAAVTPDSSLRSKAAAAGWKTGIDVSHWQSFIHWREVAAAGVDFAIAKATDGTWMVDHWYHRNKARAENNGILFTAYHFARPSRNGGSVQADARREADFFLKHADLTRRNLVPALDLEAAGGLSSGQLADWTLAWLRRVEDRLGVKPMVYSSPGFWTGRMGNTRQIARAGYDVLWVAHYGTDAPSVPGRRWDGHGWSIWQYTERGRVPGVRNRVDRNYFRGADLRDLTIRRQRAAGDQ